MARKTETIQIRVSPEEKAQIHLFADQAGMIPSQFIITRSLGSTVSSELPLKREIATKMIYIQNIIFPLILDEKAYDMLTKEFGEIWQCLK